MIHRVTWQKLTPRQQTRLSGKAVALARSLDRMIVLALRYGYTDLADSLIRRKEALLVRYGLPAYIKE